MESEKVQIKLFLTQAERELDFGQITRVFHRWVKSPPVPELLIDVATYEHVFHGPKVLLVGHQADYSLDESQGRLGLLYFFKRGAAPSPAGNLRQAFARLLRAAQHLQSEPELKEQLRFRTDEWLVRIPDRLLAPNNAAGFNRLCTRLTPIYSQLYPGELAAQSIEWMRAPRTPLSVAMRASVAPTLHTLIERIGA